VNWPAVTEFTVALLGRPYAPQVVTPTLAAWLGVGALACATIAVAVAARRERERILPWATLALSSAGAALLIALARAGSGADQALASHYVTAVYPLGLAVLVGLGLEATRPGAARPLRLAFGVVSCLALLHPLVVSVQWSRTLREWAAIRDGNAAAIVAGVATDEQIRQSHHPRPALVRTGLRALRLHRLTLFRKLPGPRGGEVVGWLDLVDDRPAHGGGTCLPVGRPFDLEGWAAVARRGWPVDSVILEVDGRAVEARLEPGLPRDDVAKVRGRGFSRSGFRLTARKLAAAEHELVLRARRGEGEAVLFERRLPPCPGAGRAP
jgi:hypothetical protein